MIRLGIDLRHLPTDGGPGAGVTHASRELAEALSKHANEYGVECIELRGRDRSWVMRGRVRRERVDAILAVSGAVPPFLGVPSYPWVHDVAIFSHPEWFPQSRLKRFLTTNLFLRGVRRAPHVFVVSEDTGRQLTTVANISPEKITVTYQGVNVSHPHVEKRDYAVLVGTIEPRKNLSFVLDLWKEVQQRLGKSVRLVIVGKSGWGNVALPSKTWLERVETANDEERDHLIAGARVLLLPSFYEGFGRPAVEAMALGTPVIASNRGALPEVVGRAGLLLDPTDRSAWVSAIASAFEGRLDVSHGFEQAAQFSWEKTARIILAKIGEGW